jgi:hypothetical protein
MPVLGRIRSETARAARSRRKIQIAVDDVLTGHALRLAFAKVLNQGSGSEICGTALPIIAEFLPEEECVLVRNGKEFASVAISLEDGADQLLMLSGQSADQNGDPVALICRKRSFDGTPILRRLLGR